jgi:flavin-dependent dehydrogenase
LAEYDVVVIGGGVAGLSTALSVSGKADATILLVEKGTFGDPTKTSPFTFPDIVERFHLSDAVLQKYTRFTYKSPTGVAASFKYENPFLVTLDYQKTCSIMLDKIKKKDNVSVLEKTEALDFKAHKLDLELNLSDSRSVSCSVLVDASGSSFFASRKLGIRLPALYSHPYGEFLEGCDIEDPEEMCIFTGKKYGNGGGWMYPIGRKTARFGFATITRSPVYPRDIVERNFRKAIRDFYPYNEMLRGAKSRRLEFGTIPIGPLKKFVYGRILVVGDAAGQATPWYNEGVRPALEGGKLCGMTVVEAYRNGKLNERILMEYQRLWYAANRRMYAYSKVRAGSYFRSQEQWDKSVRYQASLTPVEMMGIIRYCRFPNGGSAGALAQVFSWIRHARRPTDILKEIIFRIHNKARRSRL